MKLSSLRAGDILVQRDNTFWTQLAGWIAKEPYPHAMIVGLHAAGESVACWESTWYGVQLKALNEKTLQNYEVYRPLCTYETKKAALNWIERNAIDCSYDYPGLARLAFWTMLERITGHCFLEIPPGMEAGGPKAFVCSVLIAMGFASPEGGNWPLVEHRLVGDTRPWDFCYSDRLRRVAR